MKILINIRITIHHLEKIDKFLQSSNLIRKDKGGKRRSLISAPAAWVREKLGPGPGPFFGGEEGRGR